MQATVRMIRNGQVSIPIEIREALGLEPGDLVLIDVIQKVPKAKSEGSASNPQKAAELALA
ncbi:MAG: AbrB/MazE/SpoVT family DNA-binding domain-containing protein [Methanotrichaceae archaeon]